jgi:hypothetical protein
MLERPLMASRDFDGAGVAAPIAWLEDGAFLAWNRSSHHVERHSPHDAVTPTPLVLDGQPANATMAGDTLIVSTRGDDGRTTVAYSLTSGAVLWRHDDHRTHAVRCAGDHAAPCYALRLGNGADHILRINPATGELSQVVYEGERLEDLAVAPNGTNLVIASMAHCNLISLDLETATSTFGRLPLTSTRSVAFDVDGAVLVTGTVSGNRYESGHVAADGTYTSLVRTENDIMSLIRPAPDGKHVLLLARSYVPAVYELR